MEQNNLIEQCRLGTDWLGHGFAEKDLRSLWTAKQT